VNLSSTSLRIDHQFTAKERILIFECAQNGELTEALEYMEGLEEGARKMADRVREEMAAEETQKALQVISPFPSPPTIYYIQKYIEVYASNLRLQSNYTVYISIYIYIDDCMHPISAIFDMRNFLPVVLIPSIHPIVDAPLLVTLTLNRFLRRSPCSKVCCARRGKKACCPTR
jgi:hypothetical protein